MNSNTTHINIEKSLLKCYKKTTPVHILYEKPALFFLICCGMVLLSISPSLFYLVLGNDEPRDYPFIFGLSIAFTFIVGDVFSRTKKSASY